MQWSLHRAAHPPRDSSTPTATVLRPVTATGRPYRDVRATNLYHERTDQALSLRTLDNFRESKRRLHTGDAFFVCVNPERLESQAYQQRYLLCAFFVTCQPLRHIVLTIAPCGRVRTAPRRTSTHHYHWFVFALLSVRPRIIPMIMMRTSLWPWYAGGPIIIAVQVQRLNAGAETEFSTTRTIGPGITVKKTISRYLPFMKKALEFIKLNK